MKKFAIMILGISAFFTVLGGVVKQVREKIGYDESFTVSANKFQSEDAVKEDSPKSITIIRNTDGDEAQKITLSNVRIELPPPSIPGKVIEFQRQDGENVEELTPPQNDKNVFIFKRKISRKTS